MKLSSLMLVCCLTFASMHIVANDALSSTSEEAAAAQSDDADKCGCSGKPQTTQPTQPGR